MRRQIVDRYARTPDKRLMIEIDVGKIEDLYNDFDKHAPYGKKELDQDLAEYLIDSVHEIGNEEFVIQFRLTTPADNSLTTRVRTSIHNYFLYLKDLKLRELTRMTRTSLILFSLGVVILFLSVWLSQKIATDDTIISHVITEGLMVAAWVALWNAIATFFINWAPHRGDIKMYERISRATILFHEKE